MPCRCKRRRCNRETSWEIHTCCAKRVLVFLLYKDSALVKCEFGTNQWSPFARLCEKRHRFMTHRAIRCFAKDVLSKPPICNPLLARLANSGLSFSSYCRVPLCCSKQLAGFINLAAMSREIKVQSLPCFTISLQAQTRNKRGDASRTDARR